MQTKVHIKDPLLFIAESSLCGDCGFPLKQYVAMTICLMSNSRGYKNQCALEASLNQTNFYLIFMNADYHKSVPIQI